MNPSWRRCLCAALFMGIAGIAGEARAQTQAQPQQPAARSTEKSAPPKTESAKSKAAAKAKAAAGAPKMDAAAAQGEVEAGITALGQGRLEASVASLSNALSSGGLPSAQTARALYYRGVAYRRQAKPALAISDLTNALWIKAGLTEEQRADALQQRSGAYREAGLPDQSEPQGPRQASTAKPGAATAPFAAVAPPPPGGSSTSLSSSGGGFFSSLFGGGSSSQSASVAAAPASVPSTTASIAPRAPATPAATGGPTTEVQSQGPKPSTRMVPVYSSTNALPQGFQDMQEPVRHVEVSTQARAGQAQAQPSGGGAAVAKPWDETTKVKQSPTSAAKSAQAAQPSQQVAAAPQAAAEPTAAPRGRAAGPAASAAAASPPIGGSIRIQVAAVRSAEEAQGVSAKLQAQYGRDLGGRAPVIDQVSAGNFGMFYRVQVGPYATTRDTEGLCAKLRTGGLDCRIVNQ